MTKEEQKLGLANLYPENGFLKTHAGFVCFKIKPVQSSDSRILVISALATVNAVCYFIFLDIKNTSLMLQLFID